MLASSSFPKHSETCRGTRGRGGVNGVNGVAWPWRRQSLGRRGGRRRPAGFRGETGRGRGPRKDEMGGRRILQCSKLLEMGRSRTAEARREGVQRRRRRGGAAGEEAGPGGSRLARLEELHYLRPMASNDLKGCNPQGGRGSGPLCPAKERAPEDPPPRFIPSYTIEWKTTLLKLDDRFAGWKGRCSDGTLFR